MKGKLILSSPHSVAAVTVLHGDELGGSSDGGNAEGLSFIRAKTKT